ncbi:MAG: hypothetical protein M1833_004469 [Piccolia ochrophora]|nr:MAG: hypothetical protein M1833_004469 [Piccolia ochrophora]
MALRSCLDSPSELELSALRDVNEQQRAAVHIELLANSVVEAERCVPLFKRLQAQDEDTDTCTMMFHVKRSLNDEKVKPLCDLEDLYYATCAKLKQMYQELETRLHSGFLHEDEKVYTCEDSLWNLIPGQAGPLLQNLRVKYEILFEPGIRDVLDTAVRAKNEQAALEKLRAKMVAQGGDAKACNAKIPVVEGLIHRKETPVAFIFGELAEKYRLVVLKETKAKLATKFKDVTDVQAPALKTPTASSSKPRRKQRPSESFFDHVHHDQAARYDRRFIQVPNPVREKSSNSPSPKTPALESDHGCSGESEYLSNTFSEASSSIPPLVEDSSPEKSPVTLSSPVSPASPITPATPADLRQHRPEGATFDCTEQEKALGVLFAGLSDIERDNNIPQEETASTLTKSVGSPLTPWSVQDSSRTTPSLPATSQHWSGLGSPPSPYLLAMPEHLSSKMPWRGGLPNRIELPETDAVQKRRKWHWPGTVPSNGGYSNFGVSSTGRIKHSVVETTKKLLRKKEPDWL